MKRPLGTKDADKTGQDSKDKSNQVSSYKPPVRPSRKEHFETLKKRKKTKDLEILYVMWDLIQKYKQSEKTIDPIATIRNISSLSGGANGIAYNYSDDKKKPYYIRNRYGRPQKKQNNNNTNSPENRINFEHLYKLNIIIDSIKQVPNNLDSVFDQLEKKSFTY